MFFALRIIPSDQFEEFPENQELLAGFHDDDELEGHHDEPELLIEGNHDECELLVLGNQEDDDSDIQSDEELDDIIAEPSTTPTPKPIPNTASTVEIG